ncbi:MAG: hypothetical protein H0V04_03100 [Chloroflexi bacterium]|nr:hypothetical protein [Chloroflexota bacterium]
MAFDLLSDEGVWWWTPTAATCSTGGDLSAALGARLSRLPTTGQILVVYDLSDSSGMQVTLLINDDRSLRVGLDDGAPTVPLELRDDLVAPSGS